MTYRGSRSGFERSDGAGQAQRLRAVVVAPDALLVGLLAMPLECRWDIAVCGRATTAADAVDTVAARRPDLLIACEELPDSSSLSLLPQLTAANSRARAIVIARGQDLLRVRREAAAQPVIHAIVDMADGLQALAVEVGSWLADLGRVPAVLRLDTMLSPREMDVFERIGRGEPSAAIAAALSISPQTVDTHRKSITKKTGVSGAGLVRLAVLHVISTISETDGAAPPVSSRS